MNAKEQEALLKEAAAKLIEHFDYVQIFVGVREDASSYAAKIGNGDWYARYGACREWIIQAEEQMRMGVRNVQGT